MVIPNQILLSEKPQLLVHKHRRYLESLATKILLVFSTEIKSSHTEFQQHSDSSYI